MEDQNRFFYAMTRSNPLLPIVHYTDEMFIPCKSFGNYNANGYFVSNYGRVYNGHTGYLVTPVFGRHGYYRVNINGSLISLHKLVLYSFNPNPNYMYLQVNHINGIKTDNRLINLEWCTAKENIQHAIKTGLTKINGEEHWGANHTNNQSEEVCKLLEQDFSLGAKEICSMLGMEYNNSNKNFIQDIKKGKWKVISSKYNFDKSNYDKLHLGSDHWNARFTENDVRKVCELLTDNPNLKPYQICKLLGFENNSVNLDFISNVKYKKCWKEISDQYNFDCSEYTDATGENHWNSKITEKEVRQVCELLESNNSLTASVICDLLNWPRDKSRVKIINHIKQKDSWRKISSEYDF